MATEPARVGALPRDTAIDFVRGAGILMIGVDHLEFLCEKLAGEGFINPFITWLRIGWSGAAEFFVFFSGYLAGIVYLKTLQSHGAGMMWVRAAQRSWHIYVLNLLTLCVVLLLLQTPLLTSPQVNEVSRMAALLGSDAAAAITGFLGLRFAPLYFEILNLYIVLLLLVPVVILLSRISVWLPAAISFALWLAVQTGAVPLLADHGSFNPFGWQFMFVLGVLGGMYGIFQRLQQWFSRDRLLKVSGGFLLLAFLVKVLDRSGWSVPLLGPFDMPGYDKPNLGPLQLVHFLFSVVFVMQIVPRSREVQSMLAMRAVTQVGRRSLECFCMSTILVYAASALLSRVGAFDPVSMLTAGAAIVVGLCLFAPFVDWIETKPWRGPRRKPGDVPRDVTADVKSTPRADETIVRRPI